MTSLLLPIVIESISCWVKDTVVRKTSGTADMEERQIDFIEQVFRPPAMRVAEKGRCGALPSVRAGRVNCCNVL